MQIDTVVFDLDGTLVDSSYHHLIAWSRAFDIVGVDVGLSDLHAYMGMGGDKLVAAVAGDEVEDCCGEDLRTHWSQEYDKLLDEVKPLDGAVDLLARTEDLGCAVVLASSGKAKHLSRSLDLLGLEHDRYPVVTADDVAGTKPDPDLVAAAMDKVGASTALVVGDTVWDVEAALRAGARAVGVRSGGISEAALRRAGACAVYQDPAALLGDLENLLGRTSVAQP